MLMIGKNTKNIFIFFTKAVRRDACLIVRSQIPHHPKERKECLMKKKTAATVCMVSMLLLSGCGKKDQITNNYQEGASQWSLVGSVPLGAGPNYQPPTPFLGVIGTDLFASFSCPFFWNDGVHRSSDNGVSWTKVMPDSIFVSALAVKGNSIFAAYSFWDTTHLYHYGISRSTDKGVTWSPTALSNTTDSLQAYSLAANSSFIFAGTKNGVYRSSSNGDAWTPVPSGYTFMVQSIAVNNSYIFAGTYIFDGCVGYNTPKIYRSSDNGDSWAAINDSIFATTLAVSGTDLFAISMDPANLYKKYGLYRSSDNGMTWKDVLSFPLSGIAISGDTIIISTSPNGNAGNILFSADKGATWTQTEGVCVATSNLVVNNGYLFTVDLGGNIWRRPLVGL
jgi:photosystem II stability/assembly factor-like uncharacterized protein